MDIEFKPTADGYDVWTQLPELGQMIIGDIKTINGKAMFAFANHETWLLLNEPIMNQIGNKMAQITRYQEWIKANYPTPESCLNQCNDACRKMLANFQELEVRAGVANGRWHCWCVDDHGGIVDPTKSQFEGEVSYRAVAARFLDKSEIDTVPGVVFLTRPSGLD